MRGVEAEFTGSVESAGGGESGGVRDAGPGAEDGRVHQREGRRPRQRGAPGVAGAGRAPTSPATPGNRRQNRLLMRHQRGLNRNLGKNSISRPFIYKDLHRPRWSRGEARPALDRGSSCCRRLSPLAGASISFLAAFPHPRSSNRTCRFPASGFQLGSCLRTRKAPGPRHQANEAILCP